MEEYSAEEFIFDFLSNIIEQYTFTEEDEETFRGVLQYIALMVPRDDAEMALPLPEPLQQRCDEEKTEEKRRKTE